MKTNKQKKITILDKTMKEKLNLEYKIRCADHSLFKEELIIYELF